MMTTEANDLRQALQRALPEPFAVNVSTVLGPYQHIDIAVTLRFVDHQQVDARSLTQMEYLASLVRAIEGRAKSCLVRKVLGWLQSGGYLDELESAQYRRGIRDGLVQEMHHAIVEPSGVPRVIDYMSPTAGD